MSRSFALLALLLTLAGAPQAQGLLLPEGARGGGLLAGTLLRDGASDLTAGVVVTPHPAIDLSASVVTVEVRGNALTALGGSLTYYLDHEGPSRAGVFVAMQQVNGDDMVYAIGAEAGGQARLAPGVFFVPTLTVAYTHVPGARRDALPITVGGGASLLVDAGRARFHVGPTATINTEVERPVVGVQGGLLLFSAAGS